MSTRLPASPPPPPLLGARRERLGQGFAYELVRDERGRHAAAGERVAGGRADRRYGGGGEDARPQAPSEQPVEHDLDGVLAREHDPAVGGEAGEGGAQRAKVRQRLDPDDGGEHHVGALRFERPREVARLLARAGDHDPAPLQCP